MESQSCLIYISMMAEDVEHFLKCLSAILDSFVESSLFKSVPHFFIGLFVLLMTNFLSFGDQPPVQSRVGKDLFPFCRLPFCLVDCTLSFQKLLGL